jgi:hypothetical protein
MHKLLLGIPAAFLVASSAVRADELVIPDVAYPTLARHAASAEAFAPAHWSVEAQASGDLNGDGRPDLAFVLRDHDPRNVLANKDGFGPDPFDTNPRILAVAFANPGGGYDLVVQNRALITRPTESNIDDAFDATDGLAIKRGVVNVTLHLFANAGGWTAGSMSYAFRFQHSRFELVGYDSSMVQRNSGETNDLSINYSTGKVKVSTGTIESDASKVRWRTLPARAPLTIDTVGDGMEFDPDHPTP